jgi:hypothetical protein
MKGVAVARTTKFNMRSLDKRICVNGRLLVARNASTEDFDEYIYSILEQMYEKGPNEQYNSGAIRCYDNAFADYDWNDPVDRLSALNQLHDMNQMRMKRMAPQIPLFAE